MSGDISFINLGAILSGPGDLLFLKLKIIFSIFAPVAGGQIAIVIGQMTVFSEIMCRLTINARSQVFTNITKIIIKTIAYIFFIRICRVIYSNFGYRSSGFMFRQ